MVELVLSLGVGEGSLQDAAAPLALVGNIATLSTDIAI